MAKEKKISYTAMDEMVKKESAVQEVEINGVTVRVKENISLQDRIDFINDVRELVFMKDENGVTDYRASLEELAMRYAIYKYFTDLKTDDFTRIYNVLCDEETFLQIYNASRYHIGIMIQAARDEIAYRKQELLSYERNEIAKILKDSREQNEKLDEITKEFKDFDMGELMTMITTMAGKPQEEIVDNILSFREKETEKKE